CILVLKRCKLSDDVLFINASEHYAKGKRQNRLRVGENGEPNDIEKIVNTYKYRTEEDRYSKRISLERIEEEGYNLNISRYISTAKDEKKIDLKKENEKLVNFEEEIVKYTNEHNKFLKELGLPLLP
ncbi:MAG: SAM-dependent methyltransferase, partial [Epsilonproteobacteria bacterium]|nr:SAM-dependent methyltransferase [Campylobacterota bacterium]